MLAVASCGSRAASSDPTSSSAESPLSNVLPATTLFVPPARNDDLVAGIAPVRVTEPCPSSTSGPDGSADMQTELARLEPMLGQVLGYGGEHNAEFGSYGLVWTGLNDASVFISFTSNLRAHRAALGKIVAHPKELIVCQVAVSGDVARALMATLVEQLRGRYQAIGLGAGGVEVVLAQGETTLAADLSARFGDAVAVTVCPGDSACELRPD